MVQKLIKKMLDEQCPYCGAYARVRMKEDSDGEFVIKACRECPWVRIEDSTTVLSGEARPPNKQKNA